MVDNIRVGIFGGSGFYSLMDGMQEVDVDTPYGRPSAPLMVGEIEGVKVAFMPRHGVRHQLPPHAINYRANAWAMKAAGVRDVIGPCAAGSLQPRVGLGSFVVMDQYVDRTSARRDTFYDGPETTHIGQAEPYCPVLRAHAIARCKALGIEVHETGTVVVIQGPRFSTVAESRWFSSMGWEVINMTQYPEAYLCRELEMSYVGIALITDYDVGLAGSPEIEPVSHEAVVKVFTENNEKLKSLLKAMVADMPPLEGRKSPALNALKGARFGPGD